ncbi:2'-5' RNA ligase family protein [Luteimicrobium subarcticum]|uniref:2'-5' RNA ligase n=1 Tax=Luteimicrobium subarcticum TaxID=620910 RepID=A0A2M8WUK1_9MICO|nr:2'-5' RNA ligase family protein [Luteimicrobium subarcticum]PJI94603.1 2'-5' RNA ligase [Luteimicrobium subarcticum]
MILPDRSASQVRIGVSLAVPEPYATSLVDARRRSGDPLADAIPPHITVVPPTVVEQTALDDVVAHLAAAAAACPAFDVELRGPGSFRPVSPVVFADLARGSEGCVRVEEAVRTGPLDVPLRFEYHPHVTVAHEVPDDALDRASADLDGFVASFTVEAVHLFEHGDDGVWRPVRAFPLGGGLA